MTFNLQEMDIEAQQADRRPPSLDVMDRSHAPMDDEIALVAASMEGKVVINISDIESYGLEHWLIGDSTNEDNNVDDEGIIQGAFCPRASCHRGGCFLCCIDQSRSSVYSRCR